MKKIGILLAMILCVGLLGCQKEEKKDNTSLVTQTDAEAVAAEVPEMESVKIELSNSEILVDGEKISEDEDAAVYKARDIIFYLEGQGIEYGDGKNVQNACRMLYHPKRQYRYGRSAYAWTWEISSKARFGG